MKGTIQQLTTQNNTGLILGSDNNHYEFNLDTWRAAQAPNIGDEVDFVTDAEGKATAVYLSNNQSATAPPVQHRYTQTENTTDESGYGMIDWFVKCISSHYFTFTGRSRRKEFWYFMLFCLIIGIITSLLDAALNSQLIGFIVNLALLIPSLTVGARRLHDIGRSGWWQLLALTGIGVFVLIYWWVKDSQTGNNEYGPSPKS